MNLTRSLVFLAVFGVSAYSHAQVPDPHLNWHTLHTHHFDIHYHDPLGGLAQRAAAIAERVHQKLGGVLQTQSHTKTQIVLSDQSESANGSASVLPYNAIRLFAVAPEDLSPLGDYDDWLSTLITHEHAHILHLDQISGIPALINAVFGKSYSPNQLWPRWFIEGLAVHEESRQTTGGRLRSSMFDMFLRMDALEGRLLRLDQISNIADRWPHGTMWYLYGSEFVDFLATRYGRDALRKIIHQAGRQTVPYALNRIAKRVIGKTFAEFYQEFLSELRTQALQTKLQILRSGVVEGKRLTFHGEESFSPRFLHPNQIGYITTDNTRRTQLQVIDRRSGALLATPMRIAGRGGFAPHPNHEELVVSSIETHRDLYGFLDLHRHSLQQHTTERLSFGARIREPDVSPDGQWVAYALYKGSTSHLGIANLSAVSSTQKTVVHSREYEQVYTPRWAPDGKSIAYSAWRKGGYRDIVLVDVRTQKVTLLSHDRAMDTGPAWAPDGKTLFFSSDRSGIANIYALDLETRVLRQVTQVLGGAYQPDISKDGKHLVYVGYTSHGFDLYTLPLSPAQFREVQTPAPERATVEPPPAQATIPVHPYSPIPTLLPRAYSIESKPDPFGQQIAVLVEGADVLGWHRYALRTAAGLERGDVTMNASYVFQRSPMPIRTHVFRGVTPRGGLVVADQERRWIADTWGGSTGISYTFPRPFDSETVSLSYTLAYTHNLDSLGGVLDPNTAPPQIPEMGRTSGLNFGWSHSNVERYIYNISPSRGRSLSLSGAVTDPLLGSDFHSLSLSWAIHQYIRLPWWKTHVLALRYAGGLSGGDRAHRPLFSLGGFTTVPISDALLDDMILGGVALRGYRPFDRAGAQYHLTQAEYRFLVARLNWGIETLPLYLNRLYANFFADYGDAFSTPFDLATFRCGVGHELLLDFTLGYFDVWTLRLGIARGLNTGGQTQVYAHIGVPF